MKILLKEVALAICKELNMKFVRESGKGVFKETFYVISKDKTNLALKVFNANQRTERTKREIDAMLICDHPNVGKLIEVNQYKYKGKDYTYLLEEFLSGGSLSDKLKSGVINFTEFYDIGLQLVDALVHISSKGLVHRDIKPDNIMFRDDGRTPVIVDFGVVRNLHNESLTHSWLLPGPGTPYYSAPEQLNNQKELIDWRSDQFSLGVTFSICLFGLHPYYRPNDSVNDVIIRMMKRETPSEHFQKICTENGLDIIVRMVSPWPYERFRRPQELVESWKNLMR